VADIVEWTSSSSSSTEYLQHLQAWWEKVREKSDRYPAEVSGYPSTSSSAGRRRNAMQIEPLDACRCPAAGERGTSRGVLGRKGNAGVAGRQASQDGLARTLERASGYVIEHGRARAGGALGQ